MLDATGNRVMRQLRQIIVTMLRASYAVGVARPENEPVDREGHFCARFCALTAVMS